MVNQEATKPPTKEEAKAALQAYGYENINFHEDESGFLSGTLPNGLPACIAGSDETGWFEVHGGICAQWLKRGGPTGELGQPLSNEEPDSDYRDPNGRRSRFQHGTIHCWPADPTNPEGKWDVDVELKAQTNVASPWTLPYKVRHLKNVIEGKLSIIDGKINEIIKTKNQNGQIYNDWDNATETASSIRKELQPYLDAFESQAFFIVTFGMLKAGKSTLVNALVGNRNVSPVGHGCETTKRSSILFLAD